MLSFRLQKSLRPLFSSNQENQEREKSHRPSPGCSSFQRYERSESILSRRFDYRLGNVFFAVKSPTLSFLFKSREKKMLAPPNVWLKPKETCENFRYWVNASTIVARYLWKVHHSILRKSREGKKLSPSSENSWFCVGNYATLLSWLLSLVPRLP